MFRHHEERKADLPDEPLPATGMVQACEVLPSDRSISRIRVEIRYKTDRTVVITEEIPNVYQPDADSPEAKRLTEMREAQQLRHAGKIPKIQLEISVGARVPVCLDPEHRNRPIVDQAALHKKGLDNYIKDQTRPKQDAPVKVRSGPPWSVPANCPTCGAPVDQAVASRADDPRCEFCHEPIPVTPR